MKRSVCATLMLGGLMTVVPAAAQGPQPKGPYADLALAGKKIALQDYVAAEKLLISVVDRLPESAPAWYHLALCRQLQGKKPEALLAARKAVQHNERFALALLLAAALEPEPPVATDCAIRAGAAAGDDLGLLRQAVSRLVALGANEPALVLLKKCLAAKPGDPETLRLEAKLAIATNQLPLAATAYKELRRQEPRDPWIAEALGNVYLAMREPDKAREVFEETLKINPSNLSVRKRLIQLMETSEASPEAIRQQKLYLGYYQWAHAAARRKAAAKPGR